MAGRKVEHLDVLIVGAGLSGVGAACQLQDRLPGKSFAVLEAREAIGGTWDLFRYPGIRSDSDMFTLGYRFKPWMAGRAIADGASIRAYIEETAAEHGITQRIRLGHRVTGAQWSSEKARWTVDVKLRSGEAVQMSCRFLYWCSGYYSYQRGFSPQFPGSERFAGEIIHPQQWPEDLDPAGQRVVVVGSGATAVTLVPALATQAAHVTMLQRSPTYIITVPSEDRLARRLRGRLPSRTAYAVVRSKNIALSTLVYELSRRHPELMKRLIRKGVEAQLPNEFDLDSHFTPRYEPWDQRLCLVPDADLFRALGSGRASIVTDRIETFTETGVRLASGAELQADIVITATGLNLELFGGATLHVDGAQVELADTVAYKGTMLSGVPNLALALGYTNASWTLKCDLIAEYVCRLLAHMDGRGYTHCVPRAPADGQPRSPILDLKSGYVLRAIDWLPRQGARPPWRLHQNYLRDIGLFRRAPLEDEGIVFHPARVAAAGTRLVAAGVSGHG
jgi:monooxygenase